MECDEGNVGLDPIYNAINNQSICKKSASPKRSTPQNKISRCQLLIVSAAALFAFGAMSTVRHILYIEDSMYCNLQYDGALLKTNLCGHPNSLVLKKMERAKKRWWSKNKQPQVEIYSREQQQVDDCQEVKQKARENTQEKGSLQQQRIGTQLVLDSSMRIISSVS